jgi:hypothetical protein
MTFTPISLLRLRSVTTAYASILEESLPELEALAKESASPGLDNSQAMGELAASVRMTIQEDETPGTIASIQKLLALIINAER